MKNSMKMSVRLPFCLSVWPDHKKTPVWKQKKERKARDKMLMILVISVMCQFSLCKTIAVLSYLQRLCCHRSVYIRIQRAEAFVLIKTGNHKAGGNLALYIVLKRMAPAKAFSMLHVPLRAASITSRETGCDQISLFSARLSHICAFCFTYSIAVLPSKGHKPNKLEFA